MLQHVQRTADGCTAATHRNQRNVVWHPLMNTYVKGAYLGNEISHSQTDEGRFHTGSERMKIETLASGRSKLQMA